MWPMLLIGMFFLVEGQASAEDRDAPTPPSRDAQPTQIPGKPTIPTIPKQPVPKSQPSPKPPPTSPATNPPQKPSTQRRSSAGYSPWGAQAGFFVSDRQYRRLEGRSKSLVDTGQFGLEMGFHREFGPVGLGLLFDVAFLSTPVHSDVSGNDMATGGIGGVLQTWIRIWRFRPSIGAGYGGAGGTAIGGKGKQEEYSPSYEQVHIGLGFKLFRRSEWEIRPYYERLFMKESYESRLGLSRNIEGFGIVLGKISDGPKI